MAINPFGQIAKAHDAKCLIDMRNVAMALDDYFISLQIYPQVSGWAGDCNPNPPWVPESWDNVMNMLIANGSLRSIPHDPKYPSNLDPWCYFYFSNYTPSVNDCGIPAGQTAKYVMIFSVEQTTGLSLSTHWNKLGAKERYCFAQL